MSLQIGGSSCGITPTPLAHLIYTAMIFLPLTFFFFWKFLLIKSRNDVFLRSCFSPWINDANDIFIFIQLWKTERFVFKISKIFKKIWSNKNSDTNNDKSISFHLSFWTLRCFFETYQIILFPHVADFGFPLALHEW